jgi:hypothetical protein
MRKKIGISLAIVASLVVVAYLLRPDYFERYLLLKSIECPNTVEKRSSKKLNDKMSSYIKTAQKNGIPQCKSPEELYKNKELIKISSNQYFIIDDLTHSYPYLTSEGEKLLNQIGIKFQAKLKGTNLQGTKFIVTSLTRTYESVKSLLKTNGNASAKSAHMHGECFDITYKKFLKAYTRLKPCHTEYLKEILADVILELKQEKECWALTEIRQPCFHIVKR